MGIFQPISPNLGRGIFYGKGKLTYGTMDLHLGSCPKLSPPSPLVKGRTLTERVVADASALFYFQVYHIRLPSTT